MFNKTNSVITLKEARKLLGNEYSRYSDEQIEKLVKDLCELAGMYIKFQKHNVSCE